MSVVMMMRGDPHNDANNPRSSGTQMMVASLLAVMKLWIKMNRCIELTCDFCMGNARGGLSLMMPVDRRWHVAYEVIIEYTRRSRPILVPGVRL